MKINNINKFLTKGAILAFALASLSFSTAHATTDFIIGNNTTVYLDNENTDGGRIELGVDSQLSFSNSSLGNSSGGSYIFTSADPLPSRSNSFALEFNSSLYVNNIQAKDLRLTVGWGSQMYVDNDIRLSGNNNSVTIMEDSTLIANFIETKYLHMEVYSYGEFQLNAESASIHASKWVSFGSSFVDSLTIATGGDYGAVIELVMTSELDAIFSNNINIQPYAEVDFNFCFCDSFIESIMNGDGYFDLVFANTITGSFSGTGTYNINVADTNGFFTWTVTDLGGEVFRISNIVPIPEPSTYAAIFGLIALAFVAYKRRK